MLTRRIRWFLLAAVLGIFPIGQARAQYYYPYGYGGYGWGGWGGGTVAGSYARGMGWYAAGAGIYNEQTAVANSINANTAMRLNEYLYESQLVQNRRYWARRDAEARENNAALAKIHDRLLNNPSKSDIDSGDALNVILDDLADPRLSYQISRVADVKIQGSLLRNIPFRNAVEAVTFSLGELGKRTPSKIFTTPAFADDLKAYKETVAELDKEVDTLNTVKPETAHKLRDILKRTYDKLKNMKDVDEMQKHDGERHLRAALGLSYMLDGPSLDIFLEGVENRNDVTIAKLLTFMHSFNLRFGVIKNPNQHEAYLTLYPVLASIRKETFGPNLGSLPPTNPKLADRTSRPEDFFAGVNPAEIDKAKSKTPPPPPPPAAKP
jgi:hypothetical protein